VRVSDAGRSRSNSASIARRDERCSNTLTQRDATLYFCTKRCKERFIKTPEKFPGSARS
jgi:hypothetical protein